MPLTLRPSTNRLVGALTLAIAGVARAQAPALWEGLPSGRFAVGFEARVVRDSTRRFGGARARPIRVSVWYPAVSAETPMPFRDYVEWYDPRGGLPRQTSLDVAAEIEGRYAAGWFQGQPIAAVRKLLALPTGAALNAPPAAGPFPVVVYVPGYAGTPLTHTVTCELLASRGYVVVSLPSVGASPWGQTLDLQGQEPEIRDAEVALSVGAGRPEADGFRVGVVGFSMGGGIAVLLAMTHPEIRAVVSLDGTPGWTPFSLLQGSNRYDAGAFRVPFLHMNSTRDPTNDETLIRRLAIPERFVVTLRGPDHHDFIARNIIAKVVTGTIGDTARVAYATATRYVAAFIDAFVGNDAASRGWLMEEPERHGVPRGFAALHHLDEEGHGFDAERLTNMLAHPDSVSRALAEIRRLHAAMHGEGPIRPAVFDLVAGRLREQEHDAEAASVLETKTLLFEAKGEERLLDRGGLSYARIPAGTFEMGCVAMDSKCDAQERPRHRVRLTRPYWMSTTEATVAAYRAFVRATKYQTVAERRGQGRMFLVDRGSWEWVAGLSWEHPISAEVEAPDDWPVAQVDPSDAEAYCAWAGGRLPTEAEWERAARGGRDGEPFIWGKSPTPQVGTRLYANGPDAAMRRLIPAWQAFEGFDDGFATLAPVARFSPNAYGLYDMAGNVYEWTSDRYDSLAYRRRSFVDPRGPSNGESRVVRGGAWGYFPYHLRSSFRGYFPEKGFVTATVGFRCARDSAR